MENMFTEQSTVGEIVDVFPKASDLFKMIFVAGETVLCKMR
jgi:hypothetical protein